MVYQIKYTYNPSNHPVAVIYHPFSSCLPQPLDAFPTDFQRPYHDLVVTFQRPYNDLLAAL
jgi:hypothetical protein